MALTTECRVDTPLGRHYRVPGPDGGEVLYPSVTTVIAGGKKILAPHVRRAADLGTQTHELIERFLTTGRSDCRSAPDPVLCAFESWLLWWSRQAITVLDVERVVYSHKLRSAGTTDMAGTEARSVYGYDWKTGHFYPEYDLQAAVYGAIYEEQVGLKVHGFKLVRLCKDPDYGPDFEERLIPASDFPSLLASYACLRADFPELTAAPEAEKAEVTP